MSFRPEVDNLLTIDGARYRFTEHPAAPGLPYGQDGRRATIYQLASDRGEFHALKVFKPAFVTRRIAEGVERLRPFAALRGLAVCERTVLTPERHATLLAMYPELRYAVLMPWAAGRTWQEFIAARGELTPSQSKTLAIHLARTLADMEARSIAHCDLSGPNVVLTLDPAGVALVDVEDLFGPTMSQPEKLPAGSLGYAHRTVGRGIWCADADRFAGAILLAELLGWCDQRIALLAHEEQFFDPHTMQVDTEESGKLGQVLAERWGTEIAEFLRRAWTSQTLAQCPTFLEWLMAIRDAQYISPPEPADRVSEPVRLPAKSPEAELDAVIGEPSRAMLRVGRVIGLTWLLLMLGLGIFVLLNR